MIDNKPFAMLFNASPRKGWNTYQFADYSHYDMNLFGNCKTHAIGGRDKRVPPEKRKIYTGMGGSRLSRPRLPQ